MTDPDDPNYGKERDKETPPEGEAPVDPTK